MAGGVEYWADIVQHRLFDLVLSGVLNPHRMALHFAVMQAAIADSRLSPIAAMAKLLKQHPERASRGQGNACIQASLPARF